MPSGRLTRALWPTRQELSLTNAVGSGGLPADFAQADARSPPSVRVVFVGGRGVDADFDFRTEREAIQIARAPCVRVLRKNVERLQRHAGALRPLAHHEGAVISVVQPR